MSAVTTKVEDVAIKLKAAFDSSIHTQVSCIIKSLTRTPSPSTMYLHTKTKETQ